MFRHLDFVCQGTNIENICHYFIFFSIAYGGLERYLRWTFLFMMNCILLDFFLTLILLCFVSLKKINLQKKMCHSFIILRII